MSAPQLSCPSSPIRELGCGGRSQGGVAEQGRAGNQGLEGLRVGPPHSEGPRGRGGGQGGRGFEWESEFEVHYFIETRSSRLVEFHFRYGTILQQSGPKKSS